MINNNKQVFIDKFYSRYQGIMKWDDFEDFWHILKSQPTNWFYYDTAQIPPEIITSDISVELEEIYKTIKYLHKERYCGIIYTDDLKKPELVKIFHPHNLGKSCGSSQYPPLPKWLISKIKPIDIVKEFGEPPAKKGWLEKLIN